MNKKFCSRPESNDGALFCLFIMAKPRVVSRGTYERSELGEVGEGFRPPDSAQPLTAATRRQAAKSRTSPLKERGGVVSQA